MRPPSSAWEDQLAGYVFLSSDQKQGAVSEEGGLFVYTWDNARETLPELEDGPWTATPITLYDLMMYTKQVDIVVDVATYAHLKKAFSTATPKDVSLRPLIWAWQQSLIGATPTNGMDVSIYFKRGEGEDFNGGVGKARLQGT